MYLSVWISLLADLLILNLINITASRNTLKPHTVKVIMIYVFDDIREPRD
jgi:hypothetical protein